MNGEDRPEADTQTGLLFELTPGGIAQVFVPLHVTTGDAPLPLVRAGAAAEQDAVAVLYDDGDADRRIAVLNEATGSAYPSLAVAHHSTAQRRRARRAIDKFH